jgi:hypothetical protein
MIMPMHMHGAAKVLEKRDRSRLDFGPLETSCDRLVHVILTEGSMPSYLAMHVHRTSRYLTAIGATVDPVPPLILSGWTMKANSLTLSVANWCKSRFSRRKMPYVVIRV